MRKNSYEENSEPENKLDIAFIAENSKEIADSISQSMSEDLSVSAISRCASHSPFLGFSHEISMESWGSEKEPILFKGNSIPEEKQSAEEQEVEKLQPFRKKRLNDKMKLITTKMPPHPENRNTYKLRSKGKHGIEMKEEESSSSEEIRKIVEELNKKEKKGQAQQRI